MPNLRLLPQRLLASSVVWTWMAVGLRLAAGILILPLLLRLLSKDDLGMYIVFLNLIALTPIIDFGFSVSIGRYVSYAMGGATELRAMGLMETKAAGGPNLRLLWQLLAASRQLYQFLALAAFVLLGVWGTYNVELNVAKTSIPWLTRTAWGLTLLAAVLDLYLNWWNTFLRSTDRVRQSSQFTVIGFAVQLAVAAGLLLAGGGLLSMPAGSILGNSLMRWFSRRACLELLGHQPPAGLVMDTRRLLVILWPNTWRTGLQFFSSYLGGRVPGLIFAGVCGTAALAPFGVSQILVSVCGGLATVWMQVKWPLVGQYRAQHDLPALRRLLWQRFWLQVGSYLVLAAGAVVLGPLALELIGSGKQLLPLSWLLLLALVGFLDMLFAFWTTLLSMGNRIPSLWPTVATNVVTMAVFFLLLRTTTLGVGALVLAPLLAGALFNYWYWHFAGARSLGTSLGGLLLTRPR